MSATNFAWASIFLLVRRSLLLHLAGLLLVPLLLSACNKPPKPSPSTVTESTSLTLKEGKSFPAVTLKTLSGESVPLQSFQGKLLILNIWATWCSPCRREMPGLEHLSKTLDPQRFAVLGLSTDGDELLATEFLSSNHISFPNYFDRNGQLAKQMGMDAYPETFLIGQDGTLIKRVLGEQDWSNPAMIQVLEDAYKLNTKPAADTRRTINN
jgi:peroxiredoxin